MQVCNVQTGMILRCEGAAIVQALTDARYSAKNGPPNSYVEVVVVDLLTQARYPIGAAHPSQGHAPSLELVGWACRLA